jgi:hypothetical protein
MSEVQQTSSERLFGRLSGQFSAIDAILGAISGDTADLVGTCIRLTEENKKQAEKIAELEKKQTESEKKE